jgi:hypothetical protein
MRKVLAPKWLHSRRTGVLVFLGLMVLVFCQACTNYASTNRGHQFGYIDKTGHLVIDLHKYDYYSNPLYTESSPVAVVLGSFSCGRAHIGCTNWSQGTLDQKGNPLFLPKGKYLSLDDYSEGLAMVRESGPRCGYIDLKGNVVIAPQFSDARSFSEGLAAVTFSRWIDSRPRPTWFYIDKSGKQCIDGLFEEALEFSEGVARVKLNKKMGVIDKSGRFVVAAKYDMIYPCTCGIIVAREGLLSPDWKKTPTNTRSTLLYFDKTGRLLFTRSVTQPQLGEFSVDVGAFLDPHVAKSDDSGSFVQGAGIRSWGFADPSYFNDLAVAQVGSKYGYIDKKGNLVIPAIYDYACRFSDGMAIVYSRARRRFAYIDTSGRQVTPFQFKVVTLFSEGMAVVRDEDQGPLGFIDKTGKYAIKPVSRE